MTRERLQSLLTIAMTIATLAIAVVVVHREFFSPTGSVSTGGESTPTFVSDWTSYYESAIRGRDSSAKVQIVEFSDLECPACKQFDASLRAVRKKLPGHADYAFVHFPLPQHRFARLAARGAECADRAGRFDEFIETVFAHQDSLGFANLIWFARSAGIKDTVRFGTCLKDPGIDKRIDAGLALGRRIGLRGTPTILINGWRFPAALGELELEEAIVKAGSGQGFK